MDKYEILGTIGNGSFGVVHKAKETSTENIVALKIVDKSRFNKKELKNFYKECRIHSYVKHPNIIQMVDAFETPTFIGVVTALAHTDLTRFLKTKKLKYLPEPNVQKLTWDLFSALFYLHSHRIVHRDLKPENILLDENGENAKLCDFGLARNMTLETHLLTSMKGTPLYMSPELFSGNPYDFRADFWSGGCIIYKTLCGKPPFKADSVIQLHQLLQQEAINWDIQISDDCRTFLQGLLVKDPSSRFEWTSVLAHPFIKDHLVILEDTKNELPLTNALTDSQNLLKEQQRHEIMLTKQQKREAKKMVRKTLPQYVTTDDNDSTSSLDSIHVMIIGEGKSEKKIEAPAPPSSTVAENDTVLKMTDCADYFANFVENPNLVVKRFSESFNLTNNIIAANKDNPAAPMAALDDVTETLKNTNLIVNPMNENLQKDAEDYKLTKDNNLEKLQRHLAIQQFQQRNRDVLARIGNQSMQLHRRDLDKQKISQNLDNFSLRLGNNSIGIMDPESPGNNDSMVKSVEAKKERSGMPPMETKWNICDNYQSSPIENEEWLAFLQTSMQEILDGEVESLKQANLVGIIVAILRNFNASWKVIETVTQLLSLPLILETSDMDLSEIKNVYLQTKLLPNLIFASKLIYTVKTSQSVSSTASSTNVLSVNILKGNSEFRKTSDLTNEESKTVCSLFELTCHLAHLNDQFLSQFCDSVDIIASDLLIHILSDVIDNPLAIRMINTIIAILCFALRELPENAKIIENIIFHEKVNLVQLLKYDNSMLKSRLCMLLRIIGRFSCYALQNVWSKEMKESLEALANDVDENVQQKAKGTIEEYSYFSFYNLN